MIISRSRYINLIDLQMIRRKLALHVVALALAHDATLAVEDGMLDRIDAEAFQAEPGKILLDGFRGILYHHIEVYPEGPAVRHGPLKFGWLPPPPMPSQDSISQSTTAFLEMASV